MTGYHGLSLRDLDDMTPEGLAMLEKFAEWAVKDFNRMHSGKGG